MSSSDDKFLQCGDNSCFGCNATVRTISTQRGCRLLAPVSIALGCGNTSEGGDRLPSRNYWTARCSRIITRYSASPVARWREGGRERGREGEREGGPTHTAELHIRIRSGRPATAAPGAGPPGNRGDHPGGEGADSEPSAPTVRT